MTVKQAAKKIGVSDALMYRLIGEGRIAHLRVGSAGRRGKIIITEADLERFEQSVRFEPQPQPQRIDRPVSLRHLKV